MRQRTSRLRSRAAALLATAAVMVAGIVPLPAADQPAVDAAADLLVAAVAGLEAA